jgi:hypothetical protein
MSRVATKMASTANEIVCDLGRLGPVNSIFEEVNKALDVCSSVGFRFYQDDVPFILCGEDGRFTVSLAHDDKFDHMLVVSYHKFRETGRFEVVMYVS